MERSVTRFSLFPVTRDEDCTCKSLLEKEPSSRLTLMPTHHMDEAGDLCGFRYDCDAHAPATGLPLSRRMFFGHTAVQCQVDENTILRLQMNGARNKDKMTEFLAALDGGCVPATLDCMPDNTDAMTGHGLLRGTDLRTVDCKEWTPEVPEQIGIYHAYLRGYNRDVRTHRLFIVCSGGMERACDMFCNLIIDTGHKCTAAEVAESEEAWWLRRACQRSRTRTMKLLADFFGLKVPCMQDIQAYNTTSVVIPCTDTVEQDLICRKDRVSVFNACCDTSQPFNGMLARMSPAEGVWLFHGASRNGGFGSTFGDSKSCGAFPVTQPCVARRGALFEAEEKHVVRMHSKTPPEGKSYMCFDEAYFRTLEQMQWNRDNGYIQLMPIVVGLK